VNRRWAIYFAPPPGSELAAFGARWLGRDPWGGAAAQSPRPFVASPRRYGFHATLVAPFASPLGHDELAPLVDRFAAGEAAFEVPALRLAVLDGFVALVPGGPCPQLTDFATRCVEAFAPHRAPPGEAELARRRAAGLTPRQEELLRRWGYPYVMEEFRFHMTLSERLAEAARAPVLEELAPLAAPFAAQPLRVDAVTLFEEPAPGADFRALARFALRR